MNQISDPEPLSLALSVSMFQDMTDKLMANNHHVIRFSISQRV